MSENLKLSTPPPSYPLGVTPVCHPSAQLVILVLVVATAGVFILSVNKNDTLDEANPWCS